MSVRTDGMSKSAILAKLRGHKQRIAAERDKLRETLDWYEELISQCDRAEDGLETAIDALSEYL